MIEIGFLTIVCLIISFILLCVIANRLLRIMNYVNRLSIYFTPFTSIDFEQAAEQAARNGDFIKAITHYEICLNEIRNDMIRPYNARRLPDLQAKYQKTEKRIEELKSI